MADLSAISFGGNAQALVRMLREAMTEEVSDKSAALVNGVAADFPAYKELVGHIAGLNRGLELLAEISAQVFEQK